MSGRSRLVYLKRHQLDLSRKMREKNKGHLARMEEAGRLFNARHGTQDDVCGKHGRAGIEFVETPQYMHYGKIVCKLCASAGAPDGLYIRWVPFPMGAQPNLL